VIENGVKKIKRWGERWDIKLVVVGEKYYIITMVII
jgi:hypothetical protein